MINQDQPSIFCHVHGKTYQGVCDGCEYLEKLKAENKKLKDKAEILTAKFDLIKDLPETVRVPKVLSDADKGEINKIYRSRNCMSRHEATVIYFTPTKEG